MSRFFIKPLVWNTNDYQRPSGVHAAGYPAENGFGHEEWNNSPRLLHNGLRYFYTNYVATIQRNAEEPFVLFMIASHDGVQQLVGIAGQTSVIRQHNDIEVGPEFEKEAWAEESVKEAFGNNEKAFGDRWAAEIGFKPNCVCPADHYLWLPEPVDLDPRRITGRNRFIGMFSRYQSINADQARLIMRAIPRAMRIETWRNILADIDHPAVRQSTENLISLERILHSNDSLLADIEELEKRKDLKSTVRKQLIAARMGQGGFRRQVMAKWNNSCAITGCTIPAVLQACHIKPWKYCDDQERLDPNNGIILTANFHALFDAGLIAIRDNRVEISASLSNAEVKNLGIAECELKKSLDRQQRAYLRQR